MYIYKDKILNLNSKKSLTKDRLGKGKSMNNGINKYMQPKAEIDMIKNPKGLPYLFLTLVLAVTSALSILFVYNYFGDKELFISLGFLTLPVIALLCVLLVMCFLFDTLRFYCILKTLRIKIPFTYMIKLSFINIFVSNITPFATGGGFAQIYLISKKNIPVGNATAASSIRTLLLTIFLLIATPFVLLMNSTLLGLFPGNMSFIYIGVMIAAYSAIAYVLYKLIINAKVVKAWIYSLAMFLKKKKILSPEKSKKLCKVLFREIESCSKGFNMFLRGNKKHIVLSVMFTLLYMLSMFMFPVILTYAMGYHISAFTIIGMQIIVTFITYIAPTPGASGIAEAGFALIFSSLVSKGDIVSLTMTWRFFSIYVGVLIGLVVFYIEIFKGFRLKSAGDSIK